MNYAGEKSGVFINWAGANKEYFNCTCANWQSRVYFLCYIVTKEKSHRLDWYNFGTKDSPVGLAVNPFYGKLTENIYFSD